MVTAFIFLTFADFLYNGKDYERAAIEFKRLIYEYPDSTRFYMKTGDCYFNLQKYNDAIKYYKEILGKKNEDTAAVRIIVSYLLLNLPDSAEFYLGYSNHFMKYMKALIEVRKGNKEYYDYFGRQFHKRKSPVIAGLLSIVPGMGKLYSGRKRDACFSVSIIPLFAGLTYYYYTEKQYYTAGLFGIITTVFYAGEIYGGVNSAIRYNKYISEKEFFEVLNSGIISPLLP